MTVAAAELSARTPSCHADSQLVRAKAAKGREGREEQHNIFIFCLLLFFASLRELRALRVNQR
jgi:hypothetical protein